MPLAVVHSRALAGVDALPVAVEVHLAGGLPGFHLVGLPDTEVKEARDRVRAALTNAHFEFPARRITVNLAPADLRKGSGALDLPIAVGILAATAQLPAPPIAMHEFAGELALSGELRSVRGALPMALAARRAQRGIVLPASSASEAALVRDACVHGAADLLAVCAHLTGRAPLPRTLPVPCEGVPATSDIADVRGQAGAKRALLIAAAGQHSVLFTGPPGAGKSMLAQRLPGLLPPLDEAEALEVASIASIAGRFDASQWRTRPFRAPHHTASGVALVGGGGDPRPGEISLAHRGVLFLDELPEWDRRVLEVLREPLESGVIHVSRAARQASFPAEFQLVAAMNPCPCGWHGDASGRCRCTPDQVQRYRQRVSGPLLDRIDLAVDVAPVPVSALATPSQSPAVGSETLREQVLAARTRQHARQGCSNARLPPGRMDVSIMPDSAGVAMLARAAARLALSARGFHRTLKVARTIADLEASAAVHARHVAEALAYRRVDPSLHSHAAGARTSDAQQALPGR